jgi:hypothetical protein
VNDERRKIAGRQAQAAGAQGEGAAAPAAAASSEVPAVKTETAIAGAAVTGFAAARADFSAAPPGADNLALESNDAPAPAAADAGPLAETMPTGVRMIGGRALAPDVLRNRLSTDQQAEITAFTTEIETNPLAVQGAFVAGMLASEPAKWRMQLAKLGPVLGIELMKETQAQVARIAQLSPAARLPALQDLMSLLDAMDPAHRKRLRAVARAFAPTVATFDMFRFVLTRLLEKKLSKAKDPLPPVPLPDRAASACTIYSALAQCRFGAGRQGQNSYRAGVMGMLPPKQWASYPDALLTPAELDLAIAELAQVHPTGKRAFSEGMARVISVGGRLTVPQVDLLRGICPLLDCAVPVLPIDVVYEEDEPAAQARAR